MTGFKYQCPNTECKNSKGEPEYYIPEEKYFPEYRINMICSECGWVAVREQIQVQRKVKIEYPPLSSIRKPSWVFKNGAEI